MKSTMIAGLLLAVLPTLCFAKSLRCEIKESSTPMSSAQIETVPHRKLGFGQTPNVIAYVTEYDNGNFTLEGFLVNYEARFYSAGVLKSQNDRLIASLWSRQVLIDLQCTLLK
ncbi:MAG: hypothetical protein ACJ763_06195 [Bdellovibrionia bacterium]